MEQHICYRNVNYIAKNPELRFTKEETNQAQIIFSTTEMP